MYKSILGKTLKPSDLQSEDPDLYKNLKFLMENDVSFLGYEQNFAFEDNSMGLGKVIELKENGVNIIVNENNKREYMELLCNKKMSYDIEKQMANFLKGFYEIIPKELISMFDENELELLISGISKIDVEDLKRNTEYKQCTKNTLQVQWFWRAMKSFSQTELAKFMQYVTGTSKIPLQVSF